MSLAKPDDFMNKKSTGTQQWVLPSQALAIDKQKITNKKEDTNTQQSIRVFNHFKVHDINLLIDAKVKCQVELNVELYPMPNSAYSMLGVSSYKGNIVPVFSLYQFLSKGEPQKSNRKYLLIFGEDESYLGLLSDFLPTKILLSEEMIQTQMLEVSEKLDPCILRNYQSEKGEIYFELDSSHFFKQLVSS
ncbi:chemotaxis protein CheW [Aliikangiella sp. IMCC44359]|uniref:chemotaxis protein CheW n=1 Tax=Aliikangiella sp. IMCC44359 TaxID=3459125 RepID=UPI00403AB1EE